eukprot:COSAG04_NODE_5171_length_1713_cov_6.622057_2_plen_253_part_01
MAVAAATRIQANFRGKRARDHHLQHLLHEVLETERNYVEDLTKAIEHYFKPLRLLAHTKEKLLDADAVAAIFGNLEDVLVIAEELLARIEEEVGSGGSSLGPIFKAHSFALKLYARYVSGYEDATERLLEAEKSDRFREWLAARQAALQDLHDPSSGGHLGSRASGLRDLLVKPVQRIPRYELLLKELVRVKAKMGETDQELTDALASLQEVGQHNNEVIRSTESREQLFELQRKLGKVRIVESGRHLIKTGA